MGAELRFKSWRHRLERVYLAQREVATNGFGFNSFMVGGLVVVQITVGCRRHDHIVAFSGGFDTAINPIHNRGIFGDATLPDFTPTYQNPAPRIEPALHATDEIAFQVRV